MENQKVLLVRLESGDFMSDIDTSGMNDAEIEVLEEEERYLI